ncbi:MAG: hypothetical protein IPG99_12895 [Ignavibacteria bacterium]|nr:hypothetical protein [Ignavibacteria bacterium]
MWSHSKFYDFEAIGKYIQSQLNERRLCERTELFDLKIKDPTDHNEIYPKILKYLE